MAAKFHAVMTDTNSSSIPVAARAPRDRLLDHSTILQLPSTFRLDAFTRGFSEAWRRCSSASPAMGSDTIISDSRTYGTIGAVISILTWFVAIAPVIILGAVGGVVWADRKGGMPGNRGPALSVSNREHGLIGADGHWGTVSWAR